MPKDWTGNKPTAFVQMGRVITAVWSVKKTTSMQPNRVLLMIY